MTPASPRRDCLGGRCPNCDDVPVPRPLRTGQTLADNPASTERVLQPGLHRG